MREKRDEVIILRLTKTEKNRIYEKMLGMGMYLSTMSMFCAMAISCVDAKEKKNNIKILIMTLVARGQVQTWSDWQQKKHVPICIMTLSTQTQE